MSFRIDDILFDEKKRGAKSDNQILNLKSGFNSCNNDSDKKRLEHIQDDGVFRPHYEVPNTSLLQHTLNRKSEPVAPLQYGFSKQYYDDVKSSLHNEGIYFTYCDMPAYLSGYSALHERSRYWPFYSSCTPQDLACSMPLRYGQFSKRKGGQVRFSPIQTQTLEKEFNAHKYLSPEDRKHLADSLKLSDRQVKTWFQNRRAKWRRISKTSTDNDNDVPKESKTNEDLDNDVFVE